jgi:uncharacterized membrane protein
MDPTVNEWLNLIFRWVHVVAGIAWIGHLYFFNWVNGHVVGALDAETKKKLIPELMPRALYWFRWGAAYTWISGFLLLGIVYYMGGVMVDPMVMEMNVHAAAGIGVGLLVVAWPIYDFLWKSPIKKNEKLGAGISFALVVAVTFALSMLISKRAVYIHIGAMFGTLMAANVWMRIWPNQRRIIKATKEGTPADAAWGDMAKLRSKHNTYMSVPLVFTMISSHFPTVFGHDLSWMILATLIGVGWGFVKWAYIKSGSAAPKFF